MVWAPKLGLGKKSSIFCFLVMYYHLIKFEIIFPFVVVSHLQAVLIPIAFVYY